MDKVFVALDSGTLKGMRILGWVFDQFQNDTTQLVLTCLHPSDNDRAGFLKFAKSTYLPRCTTKKFQTEIFTPEEINMETILLEMTTKQRMQELVVDDYWWRNISEVLDGNPDISCKIWTLDRYTGKLNNIRDTKLGSNLNARLNELTSDIEKLPNTTISVFLRAVTTSINRKLKIKKESENNLHGQETAQLEEKICFLKMENEQLKSENLQSKNKFEENLTKMQEEKTATEGKMNQLRLENQLLIEQKAKLENRVFDSELARKDLEARSTNIKERIDLLQLDYIKVQSERDRAVREAEKMRNLRYCSDFTSEELNLATQNYSDSLRLGKGGYGCVYKGYLRGTNVAVKILNSQSTESISGFKKEMAILTTVRHPNIVILMGACYDASALVYELLPNGSLESHLNSAKKATCLTWQIRTNIIAEICLALIFLHSNKPNMIIHGDLKPDNVLLDVNFVSKLGDFGISRLIKQTGSDSTLFHETNNPVGTRGYMDPEFVNSGVLTEKSDVYSFGIIILRLLTMKPAFKIAIHVEEAMKNETFHEIIDASAGEWPLDQAEELANLGLRCAKVCRSHRPNLFVEVWPILENLRRKM